MTQFTVHCPLDEGYLHDDLGLYPMCAKSRKPLGLRKGRFGKLDPIQPRAQVQQELRVKSGADFAGKHEIMLMKISNQQRSQSHATALRIRESADDELLRSFAIHLQP